MLQRPHFNQYVRLVAIDPGSKCMGFGVFDIDCINRTIHSSHSFTIYTSHLRINQSADELFGNRLARIQAIQEVLAYYFNHYRPNITICESPFMGMKQPSAYGALTEVICAVREALAQYDSFQTLYSVDPPSAKIGVGAPGNAGKDIMLQKVCELGPKLNYVGGTEALWSLDEHSIDAIAIGYTMVQRIFHTHYYS